VIQRGNNRQVAFYTGEDSHFYLECLSDAAQKYGCLIHAYVLMTNHVHLLATPLRALALSRTMQHLGRRYVRYVNDRYRRSGTLVSAHDEYGRLGSCPEERQAAYRALFDTELSGIDLKTIRTTVNQGWPLGGDRFKNEIEQALKRVANPPKRGRPTRSGIDKTESKHA
jgi:putative transposase